MRMKCIYRYMLFSCPAYNDRRIVLERVVAIANTGITIARETEVYLFKNISLDCWQNLLVVLK